jgi:hypothetical protein
MQICIFEFSYGNTNNMIFFFIFLRDLTVYNENKLMIFILNLNQSQIIIKQSQNHTHD